jgi:hypothetical protein
MGAGGRGYGRRAASVAHGEVGNEREGRWGMEEIGQGERPVLGLILSSHLPRRGVEQRPEVARSATGTATRRREVRGRRDGLGTVAFGL